MSSKVKVWNGQETTIHKSISLNLSDNTGELFLLLRGGVVLRKKSGRAALSRLGLASDPQGSASLAQQRGSESASTVSDKWCAYVCFLAEQLQARVVNGALQQVMGPHSFVRHKEHGEHAPWLLLPEEQQQSSGQRLPCTPNIHAWAASASD